jgi:hypothetical protein
MGCHFTTGDGEFLRASAKSSHLGRFIGQLRFYEGWVQRRGGVHACMSILFSHVTMTILDDVSTEL